MTSPSFSSLDRLILNAGSACAGTFLASVAAIAIAAAAMPSPAQAGVVSLDFTATDGNVFDQGGQIFVQSTDQGTGNTDHFVTANTTIAGDANAGTTPSYLNLTATDSGAFSVVNGVLSQPINGSFDITTAQNGNGGQSGPVLLSGNFNGPMSGEICSGGGCTITLGSGVTFSNFASGIDPSLAAILNGGNGADFSITFGNVNQFTTFNPTGFQENNVQGFEGNILMGDFAASPLAISGGGPSGGAPATPEWSTAGMLVAGFASMFWLAKKRGRATTAAFNN